MNKEQLKEVFRDAHDRRRTFIAVKIETEGNPAPEVILIRSESFSAKEKYYNRAYTDDLELISAKNAGTTVRIVDALATSNLSELNWFAY